MFKMMVLIYLVLIVVTLIGLWKTFEKAGQPGWTAVVPIYNIIVWLQLCGRPVWWIVLLLIPIVQIIFYIIICIDLAKSFGKEAGFGLGIFLFGFIFIPILGFGSATYTGPSVHSS